jgi:hypothetical protein
LDGFAILKGNNDCADTHRGKKSAIPNLNIPSIRVVNVLEKGLIVGHMGRRTGIDMPCVLGGWLVGYPPGCFDAGGFSGHVGLFSDLFGRI